MKRKRFAIKGKNKKGTQKYPKKKKKKLKGEEMKRFSMEVALSQVAN